MLELTLYRMFKELKRNISKPIPGCIISYVVNTNGLIGVAVETSNHSIIREHFNDASIVNTIINREGAEREVIFLYTKESNYSSYFNRLCCDFVMNESLISENPIEWYSQWKNVLGNAKKDKMIYDVIGEMKILLYLIRNNKRPSWDSTNNGTYDICADDGFYEIKTSITKTSEQIVIHNQFQLDYKYLDRPLYITYCKVEKNDSGDSIDSLFDELVRNGYSKNEMSMYLDSKGYYEGNNDRRIKYLIHEVRKYEVNDKFPRIVDESFMDGKIPNNILKIEYTLSLDGLDYEKIL